MPHAHLDAATTIHAPVRAVTDRMSDLSRFNDWNPFPSMDATTVSRHEGARSGVGAIIHYEGKRLGKGRMEIVSVDAPLRIDIAMTFWRGGTATHSQSAFVLGDRGEETEVRWAFDEVRKLPMYLLGKLLFERMMTRTFEGGLATLKSRVEAEARA